MKKIKKRAPKMKTATQMTFQCRLSYCHLDKPWAGKPENTPKYSVSCIIPKEDTDTISAIEKAIEAAIGEGVTKKWKGTRPNVKSTSFKYPLKDGDVERPNDEAYAGCMFLGANSNTAVPVLNLLRQKVAPEEAYSGCWALVSVGFFPFDAGAKGVGAGLNAVLKVADDERLGGGRDASGDFDVYDDLEPDDEDLEDL